MEKLIVKPFNVNVSKHSYFFTDFDERRAWRMTGYEISRKYVLSKRLVLYGRHRAHMTSYAVLAVK